MSISTATQVEPTSLQVLRLPQVCKVTGLCRSMIYQLEADDRFPRRIKIGIRAVGWLQGEVQDWLERRVQQSRRPQLVDIREPTADGGI